jgi:transcriptional regulator with XRE-family HTH domain
MTDTAKMLNDYMLATGIDQKTIARTLGVTQQAVSLWLKGVTPRGARLRQIEQLVSGEVTSEVVPVPVPALTGSTRRLSNLSGLSPEERAKAIIAVEVKEAKELIDKAAEREAELVETERKKQVVRDQRMQEMQESRRKYVRECEEEFLMALPEELSGNSHHVTHFNGLPWPCDYKSAKICADVTVVSEDANFFPVEHCVLYLAAIKAMHGNANESSEKYISIISGGNDTLVKDRRLQAMCAALGIELVHAPDTTAAAAIVADAEYGPM